jgi:hypothetical protein
MNRIAIVTLLSLVSLSSCIVVHVPVAMSTAADSSLNMIDPHDTLKTHVNCAHAGFHFVGVAPTGKYASIAPKMGFGFDIEGYSKNLTTKKKFATYLGADLLVAWKDRTEKTMVDVVGYPMKGQTYLENTLIASHFNARFEMNKKKFRPYLLGSIGWLGFATDQMVRANNTTNSTNSVIMGTLNTSLNLGFRYFIQKQVALDCRLGYNMPSATRLGEIQHAVYDPVGTIYNIPDVALNPNFFTFKIGFLFCLSSDRHLNAQSSYYRDNYYRSRSYTPSYNVPKPIIKPAVPIMQN